MLYFQNFNNILKRNKIELEAKKVTQRQIFNHN